MSIFQDPPVTWTPDTKCDVTNFNKEIKEKMDDIDAQFPVLSSIRQDKGVNTNLSDITILHGWGFVLGNNANQISVAVTFGITFSNIPIVLAQAAGILAGMDPVVEADLFNIGTFHARAYIPTTTGFTIDLSTISRDGSNPGVFASTSRWGYKFIVIGQLA